MAQQEFAAHHTGFEVDLAEEDPHGRSEVGQEYNRALKEGRAKGEAEAEHDAAAR